MALVPSTPESKKATVTPSPVRGGSHYHGRRLENRPDSLVEVDAPDARLRGETRDGRRIGVRHGGRHDPQALLDIDPLPGIGYEHRVEGCERRLGASP
jgi:hypothetical protein